MKLAGMIYRDVNIALANQLANYAEATGFDAAAVFDAANTDGESALLSPASASAGTARRCTRTS